MIKFPRVHYDGSEYAVVHFEKVMLYFCMCVFIAFTHLKYMTFFLPQLHLLTIQQISLLYHLSVQLLVTHIFTLESIDNLWCEIIKSTIYNLIYITFEGNFKLYVLVNTVGEINKC